MDTNYLLKREQLSLMMADAAASKEARHAHLGLARGYGALLSKSPYPHRRSDRGFAASPRGRG